MKKAGPGRNDKLVDVFCSGSSRLADLNDTPVRRVFKSTEHFLPMEKSTNFGTRTLATSNFLNKQLTPNIKILIFLFKYLPNI